MAGNSVLLLVVCFFCVLSTVFAGSVSPSSFPRIPPPGNLQLTNSRYVLASSVPNFIGDIRSLETDNDQTIWAAEYTNDPIVVELDVKESDLNTVVSSARATGRGPISASVFHRTSDPQVIYYGHNESPFIIGRYGVKRGKFLSFWNPTSANIRSGVAALAIRPAQTSSEVDTLIVATRGTALEAPRLVQIDTTTGRFLSEVILPSQAPALSLLVDSRGNVYASVPAVNNGTLASVLRLQFSGSQRTTTAPRVTATFSSTSFQATPGPAVSGLSNRVGSFATTGAVEVGYFTFGGDIVKLQLSSSGSVLTFFDSLSQSDALPANVPNRDITALSIYNTDDFPYDLLIASFQGDGTTNSAVVQLIHSGSNGQRLYPIDSLPVTNTGLGFPGGFFASSVAVKRRAFFGSSCSFRISSPASLCPPTSFISTILAFTYQFGAITIAPKTLTISNTTARDFRTGFFFSLKERVKHASTDSRNGSSVRGTRRFAFFASYESSRSIVIRYNFRNNKNGRNINTTLSFTAPGTLVRSSAVDPISKIAFFGSFSTPGGVFSFFPKAACPGCSATPFGPYLNLTAFNRISSLAYDQISGRLYAATFPLRASSSLLQEKPAILVLSFTRLTNSGVRSGVLSLVTSFAFTDTIAVTRGISTLQIDPARDYVYAGFRESTDTTGGALIAYRVPYPFTSNNTAQQLPVSSSVGTNIYTSAFTTDNNYLLFTFSSPNGGFFAADLNTWTIPRIGSATASFQLTGADTVTAIATVDNAAYISTGSAPATLAVVDLRNFNSTSSNTRGGYVALQVSQIPQPIKSWVKVTPTNNLNPPILFGGTSCAANKGANDFTPCTNTAQILGYRAAF